MPKSNTNQKEKLVTPRTNIHVVFFSCSDCGEEESEVRLCSSCGTPMRVINVVEKFGEEAEAFLEKVQKAVQEDIDEEKGKRIDEDEPNIILMGDDEHLDEGGIDPTQDDDDSGLDVIFPSDDDEESTLPKDNIPVDDDLSVALDKLDEEDDDLDTSDFGFDDMPEL